MMFNQAISIPKGSPGLREHLVREMSILSKHQFSWTYHRQENASRSCRYTINHLNSSRRDLIRTETKEPELDPYKSAFGFGRR